MKTLSKKLDEAFSKLDKDIMRQSYIAKSAPSSHEIGWLGHKKFSGTKKDVQIKFDPNDKDIKDKFIYHTHPNENPSPLTAMPSVADLETAIKNLEHELRGIVVFSGDFYTVIVPTTTARKQLKRYEDALKRGDIEDAIKELDRCGFDVETGEI